MNNLGFVSILWLLLPLVLLGLRLPALLLVVVDWVVGLRVVVALFEVDGISVFCFSFWMCEELSTEKGLTAAISDALNSVQRATMRTIVFALKILALQRIGVRALLKIRLAPNLR